MTIALRIEDLTQSGLLRRRGEQTYDKLQPAIESDYVDLNLDGMRSMSRSFMDGIILSLLNNGQLDKVTFVTDNQVFLGKLARISEIRDIQIYYRSSTHSERAVVPKSDTPQSKPVFVPLGYKRAQP